MEKLFVFNGSILIDSELSGFALLAAAVGKKEEMLEHEAHYYKVRRKGPWGSEEFAKMFEGISREALMKKAGEMVKENLMKSSREFVEKLKEKDYFIAYYSTDPLEVALALQQELGLDEVFGTEFEYENGIATGKLKTKFDRHDRAEKIKKLVGENNLARDNVIIVGDSITALPSKSYGKLIAFNTKYEELKQEADIIIEEKNLNKIAEII
jgi:phosphoserine phosphatase